MALIASAGASGSGAAEAWHALTADEVARALAADPSAGLSAGEADRRLNRWGPNRRPEAAGPDWLQRLIEQFTQFLVIVLLAAAAVSLALGEHLDAGAMLGIVVLNALLGFIQEHRAERALQSLRSMAALTATVLREGVPLRLRADLVVPGDVLDLGDASAVRTGDGTFRQALLAAVLCNDASLSEDDGEPIVDPTEVALLTPGGTVWPFAGGGPPDCASRAGGALRRGPRASRPCESPSLACAGKCQGISPGHQTAAFLTIAPALRRRGVPNAGCRPAHRRSWS